MSSLSTSILKTIAYFDIFDYPLTAFEIWQYLPEKSSLSAVTEALEDHNLPLEKKYGFYFLPGRQHIFEIRRERYLITNRKIKKTQRRLLFIQWLPGIRLICLANSIGSHNLRASSDSDLFIITKQERLWLTKLTATLIIKILGIRPTKNHSADRLCLSFLVDESNLNLTNCRFEEDYYFTYWLAGLLPLYGDISYYQKLIKANQWLREELPNWRAAAEPIRRFQSKVSQAFWSLSFLRSLEKISQKLHWRVMSPTIKNLANKNQQVLISNHILKLHTVDRREYFKHEYHLRLQKIGINI